MRRHPPADRAVSLLEMITVLAIVGVMAAIGIPRYANSLALYRAQAAASRIAADVNFARSRAKTTSAGQTLTFDVTSSSYTLSGTAGLGGQGTYVVKLTAEPYAATLAGNAMGTTLTAVTFDRYGQPSAGGNVVVKSGTASKTVTVNAVTGLASVS